MRRHIRQVLVQVEVEQCRTVEELDVLHPVLRVSRWIDEGGVTWRLPLLRRRGEWLRRRGRGENGHDRHRNNPATKALPVSPSRQTNFNTS